MWTGARLEYPAGLCQCISVSIRRIAGRLAGGRLSTPAGMPYPGGHHAIAPTSPRRRYGTRSELGHSPGARPGSKPLRPNRVSRPERVFGRYSQAGSPASRRGGPGCSWVPGPWCRSSARSRGWRSSTGMSVASLPSSAWLWQRPPDEGEVVRATISIVDFGRRCARQDGRPIAGGERCRGDGCNLALTVRGVTRRGPSTDS